MPIIYYLYNFSTTSTTTCERERERERVCVCTTTTFSQVVSISLIQQKNNLSKEMYHVVWLKE